MQRMPAGSFLQIPPFPDCGIVRIDLLIAGAVFPVIIDDPAGLQVGINRDCAQICKTVCPELFRNFI